MRLLICLLLLIACSRPLQAQNQGMQLFAYNVGFNAITAGIGAAINKPKAVNWKKALLTGAWQGGVGGTLIYASKLSLHLVKTQQHYGYAWPAKILHAAGTSITCNAALHEPFGANWHFNLGFLRFDIRKENPDGLQVRLLPWSINAIYCGLLYGKSFDWQKSIQTGELIFSNKRYVLVDFGNGLHREGASFGGSIVIGAEYTGTYALMVHEIIHEYQFREHLVFNAWVQKATARMKPTTLTSLLSKAIYPEIPYFKLANYIQGRYSPPHYYRNFYEFEAKWFATHRHVNR